MSQSPTQPVFDGMGAIVGPDGCGFRVWAPHASAVSVVGDFNDWAADADPLAGEGNGYSVRATCREPASGTPTGTR